MDNPFMQYAKTGLLLAMFLTASLARADNPDSPLFAAAATGDVVRVKTLLAEGADVNTRDKDGATALLTVAMKGYKDVVEVLLANKADVNAKDKAGWTPLHAAAEHGHKDIVELLLAHKADVNAKTEGGSTPLHVAAGNGQKDVAELLLANKADVNAQAEGWSTPLHYAANREVAELLLANKADVNAKDKAGWTPLRAAAEMRRGDVVAVLLGHSTITVDGISYSNVSFGAATPATVSIMHKTGVATIPLEKLSPDLQAYFGYDPEKAQDAVRLDRAQQAALQEMARKARGKMEYEAARNASLDNIRKNAVRMVGKVQQVTAEGALISGASTVYTYSERVETPGYRGLGGNPRVARTGYTPLTDGHEPVFVLGGGKGLIDGADWDATVYPAGAYTYITLVGSEKTVMCYALSPEDALRHTSNNK